MLKLTAAIHIQYCSMATITQENLVFLTDSCTSHRICSLHKFFFFYIIFDYCGTPRNKQKTVNDKDKLETIRKNTRWRNNKGNEKVHLIGNHRIPNPKTTTWGVEATSTLPRETKEKHLVFQPNHTLTSPREQQ